jgi:hypothetical protein
MPGRKKGASSRFSAAGAARKATTAAVFFLAEAGVGQKHRVAQSDLANVGPNKRKQANNTH